MSLRVWMPLTKDLRQQGLDSTIVTQNSGTTISSGGTIYPLLRLCLQMENHIV